MLSVFSDGGRRHGVMSDLEDSSDRVCDSKGIAEGFHSSKVIRADSSTHLRRVSSAFHGDFIEVFIGYEGNSFLSPLAYSQLTQGSSGDQN